MAVFLSHKQQTVTTWALDSVALQDAWTDFILSRQAALLSENTIKFYQYTAGRFVLWLKRQGVTSPDLVAARHVRAYLAELAGRGMKDTTIADHARAVRVLVRFWHAENYTPAPVAFQIPKVEKSACQRLTLIPFSSHRSLRRSRACARLRSG